jgi:hypothetical protein
VVTTYSIAEVLYPGTHPGFTATLLLSLTALLLLLYVVIHVRSSSWWLIVLLTLFAPTFTAISLLSDRAWHDGIAHQPFSASLLFFGFLALVTGFYWLMAKQRNNDALASAAYGLTWLLLAFGSLFFIAVWDALLTGDAERVVTAISQLFLAYLLVNILLMMRANATKVIALIVAFVVPGIQLLPSLHFSGWEGVMSINAVGVYATIVVLLLLATTVRQHAHSCTDTDQMIFKKTGYVLYCIGGLLAAGLVWIMSHTVIASAALAVTIALFVYTITGLVAYTYGRVQHNDTWLRVGILLLGMVVLRLALVDVWSMETVWRIVTFLGIGILFIGTALFERGQKGE